MVKVCHGIVQSSKFEMDTIGISTLAVVHTGKRFVLIRLQNSDYINHIPAHLLLYNKIYTYLCLLAHLLVIGALSFAFVWLNFQHQNTIKHKIKTLGGQKK